MNHSGIDRTRAALAALGSPPQTAPGRPVVTALSPGELALLEEVGLVPVGLVGGSGAASWSLANVGAGGEEGWTWALLDALGGARAELLEETARLGADGVAGAALFLEREPGNLLVCRLLGTAVADTHQEAPLRHGHRGQARSHPPFATTFGAAELHLLLRGGWRPTALVAGAAVAALPARGASQAIGWSRAEGELAGWTAGLYQARERAMAGLGAEALAAEAQGVVGVRFEERPVVSVMVRAVELLVLGTAVARCAPRGEPLAPSSRVPLDDPPPQVFQHGPD
jgi:uncharacterized protein YbjQ (UPF0145 family)